MIRRGQVYWTDLNPARGSEADKRRPCIVVSNNAANRASPVITVVPLTSNVEHVYSFEVRFDGLLETPAKAQAQQVRSVSRDRLLGEASATLSAEQLASVEDALRLHLNL